MYSGVLNVRFFKTIASVTALTVGLAACATGQEIAHKQPDKMFFKPDMTGADYVAHVKDCRESTKDIKGTVQNSGGGTYYNGAGGLIGLLAVVVVAGAIHGARKAEANQTAQDRAFGHCMGSRDYVVVDAPRKTVTALDNARTDDAAAKVIDTYRETAEFKIAADWHTAKSTNTVESYDTFLAAYPDSVFDDTAQEWRRRVAWSVTKDTHTIDAYNAFAATYPDAEETKKVPEFVQEIAHVQSIIEDKWALSFLTVPGVPMAGLTPDGWNMRSYGGGTVALECRSAYLGMDIRMQFSDGIGHGYIHANSLESKEIYGRMKTNGELELYATWPDDDPLMFIGRFEIEEQAPEFSVFLVRVHSSSERRCGVYTEFEFAEDQRVIKEDIDGWLGGARKLPAEASERLVRLEQDRTYHP